MYQPKDVYGRVVTLEDCLIQVGDGWNHLIKECYQICVENKICIAQVKEKFGTLRFYIYGGSDEVSDKIDDICARSANICEFCGEKGKPKQLTGWWKTICDKCYEEKTKDSSAL